MVENAIDECPPYFVRYQNTCYRFVAEPMTWFQAAYYCTLFTPTTYKSHLVAIESFAEHEFMMGEMIMGEFYEPDVLLKKADIIMNESKKRNLTLRLLGALAFHRHCPQFNYIQQKSNRIFTDIDFMAYIEQKRDIEQMFLKA